MEFPLGISFIVVYSNVGTDAWLDAGWAAKDYDTPLSQEARRWQWGDIPHC
ncbi:MAG TPA: hypothetical protein VL361_08365 [Candidatus Limnocylindrales bacterium]|nr:hypothetical protein [Candidatus Limnocylindrales bacterium]